MSYAKPLLLLAFVLTMFAAGYWSSVTYLTGVHEASATMRASIPSTGMLNIMIFLFWFILFLIPSWGTAELLHSSEINR